MRAFCEQKASVLSRIEVDMPYAFVAVSLFGAIEVRSIIRKSTTLLKY